MANAVAPERAVLVGPDGKPVSLPHVPLTRDQARILQDYEHLILRPMRLRRTLQCQGCQGEVEVNLDGGQVALVCACTMRTYVGLPPTVLAETPPEPAAVSTILAPDGSLAGRFLLPISAAQARLMRDYKRTILLGLRLREAAYCDRCFESSVIQHDGLRWSVTPQAIDMACRCTERHFAGITA